MPLDPRLVENLRNAYDVLLQRGELLDKDRLQTGYDTFRQQFGPERLRSLEGDALLQAMHTHGNRDSLVYWLEFKDDETFPSRLFGSIAGGSAHKFGLFRRQDTQQWVTGSAQGETPVNITQAVEIARKHRDQLLSGADLLNQLPTNADDDAYALLQHQLDARAPDVSRLAWGHKYLSLLFPEKLDDYHNQKLQRYNLIKLLQLPPAAEGLYVCAGRYLQIATELGWSINHLTTVLNSIHGAPKSCWRIGTRLGEGADAEDIWPAMRDGNYAAIGWDQIGDLSQIPEDADLKSAISERFGSDAFADAKSRSRKAGEIRNFVERIEEGAAVVAANGNTILGVGKMKGPYRFEATPPTGAPHRREVEWRSIGSWTLPEAEGLRTTVVEIRKHEENLVAIERKLLDGDAIPRAIATPPPSKGPRKLEGVAGQVQAILQRKGQVILYGPPGTGKTHWAREAARELAALGAFGSRFSELDPEQKSAVLGTAAQAGLVRTCTFHPAYGYEDFIQGYRPLTNSGGQLTFTERSGIFKSLCEDAEKRPDREFFLIIDEINRGDIPRIFGELLTLLEMDKRGMPLLLPVSGRHFSVPPNVRVIGTMNTADRSIALLDSALRRRFGFVELLPDTQVFGHAMVGDAIPLGPWLNALNERIRTQLGRDGRNQQIGHAYFLHAGKPVSDFAKFVRILAEDIIPLLQEYCYEDYDRLVKLLDEGLVDASAQRIRGHLFEPAHREALIEALLRPAPEILTSPEAIPTTSGAEEAGDDTVET